MSSIYAKLARVQMELMDMEVPKTGWNGYRKYHYYSLEDLLPPIFKACFKEQITPYFTFNNDEGVLHLKSWEKEGQIGTRDELSIRAPFPELANNGNNNDVVQDIGKSMTYIKRYLLMNTFLIIEDEIIDAEEGSDENNSDKKPSKKAPAKKARKAAAKKEEAKPKKTATKKEATKTFSPTKIPKPIRDASHLCKQAYGNITEKGIIEKLSELRAKGKLTPKMAKHWADYTRDNSKDIVKELAA